MNTMNGYVDEVKFDERFLFDGGEGKQNVSDMLISSSEDEYEL